MCMYPLSNIVKVPRGIQGEKSREDTTSSGKLASTIRAQVSPHRGQNQVFERVSVPCWHVPPLQMLHENHS